MTGRFRFVTAAVLALMAIGARAPAASEEEGIIRIGGSTTLLPIIATIADNYMKRYPTWDKVDPSLPKKGVVIYVSGGGSGGGVKSTINGTFDIGLVSRDLSDKERELLGRHQTFLVGKDAVAFVVNKANPLVKVRESFDKTELAAILSGEKKTYKDIDGRLPNSSIVLFVRDSSAGSAEIVQEKIMGKQQIAPDALQVPSQGTLLKKLETSRLAFGYISSGLALGSKQLRTFAFEGIKPLNQRIASGDYTLARPLLLLVKGEVRPVVQRFIDHVLTEGQREVERNSYVPAKGAK